MKIKSKHWRRILFGVFVFALLSVGISLPSLFTLPYSVLAVAVGTVFLSLFSEPITRITGKKQGELLLEPLQILRFGPGSNLERSQWINMAWMASGAGQHKLTALFGVIRVRALNTDAIGCRAVVRLKLQDTWLDSGYLNWYSSSLLRNLTAIPDFQIFDLSRYLTNTTEHITKDDSKDLLGFFMVENSPTVFLCSDMLHSTAGNVQNNQPFKFQIEMTVTAQDHPKIVQFLDVEAIWGRFLISKTMSA